MQKAVHAANEATTTPAVRGLAAKRATAGSRASAAVGYSGNQASLRRLSRTDRGMQCKLQVGAVNDPHESEADHVADQVMRMSDAVPARPEVLHRKCAACEEEEVHRKSDASGHDGGEAPSIVHDVLGGPGQALASDARAFFEPRFGQSLDHVRVHQDGRAAESAQAVGALAYAAGSHIVLGAESRASDRHLMAHELTHVLQQDGGDSVRRACGPEGIGKPTGCEAGAAVFGDGPTYHFTVNCDDWVKGEDDNLRKVAKGLPETQNVQIDAYASIEGPEAYNTNLACARGLKAKSVLIGAGVAASRITKVVDHGATPGPVADRRSVVVQTVAAAAVPQPATPTNPTDPNQQSQPKAPDAKQDPPKPVDPKADPTKPVDPTPNPGPTPTPTAAAAEKQPRVVIQIPFSPINVQVPIKGPGGVGTPVPAGQKSTALNQGYQPNVALGGVYNFPTSKEGRGWQIGGFGQFGVNTPLPGSARPFTFRGHPTDFTGLNAQLYLQPSYVFLKIGDWQVSALVQPGVGWTFKSPVPGEDAITYTFQGGVQVTKDIIPNKLQFFGTIVGGVGKSVLDSPPEGQSAGQPPQGFIGLSIGIQPTFTVLDY